MKFYGCAFFVVIHNWSCAAGRSQNGEKLRSDFAAWDTAQSYHMNIINRCSVNNEYPINDVNLANHTMCKSFKCWDNDHYFKIRSKCKRSARIKKKKFSKANLQIFLRSVKKLTFQIDCLKSAVGLLDSMFLWNNEVRSLQDISCVGFVFVFWV